MPLISQGDGFLLDAMKVTRDVTLVLFDFGVGAFVNVAQLVEKMTDLHTHAEHAALG
jgi:hypothetical protein